MSNPLPATISSLLLSFLELVRSAADTMERVCVYKGRMWEELGTCGWSQRIKKNEERQESE